jgi:hypothetical protein
MEDGTEEYYAQPPFYYYCQPPNPEIVRLFRDVASYLTKCDTCGAKPFKGIICPSAFKWDKLCCMSCHVVERHVCFFLSTERNSIPMDQKWSESSHIVPAAGPFEKDMTVAELYAIADEDVKDAFWTPENRRKYIYNPRIGAEELTLLNPSRSDIAQMDANEKKIKEKGDRNMMFRVGLRSIPEDPFVHVIRCVGEKKFIAYLEYRLSHLRGK